jgi:hypothetical protein
MKRGEGKAGQPPPRLRADSSLPTEQAGEAVTPRAAWRRETDARCAGAHFERQRWLRRPRDGHGSPIPSRARAVRDGDVRTDGGPAAVLPVAEAHGSRSVGAPVDDIDGIAGPGALERCRLAPRRGVNGHGKARLGLQVGLVGNPRLVIGQTVADECEELDQREARVLLIAVIPRELPPHDRIELADKPPQTILIQQGSSRVQFDVSLFAPHLTETAPRLR